MVGVPGRSKGCKTCRRRKKHCDLERPQCKQCTNRGLVCGGYDRDLVFVHQNATYSRRRSEKNGPKTCNCDIGSVTAGHSCINDTSSQIMQCNVASSNNQRIVLPQSLARSAYGERNLELYLNLYLPSRDLDRALLSKSGLSSSINQLYVQDGALSISLVALTTATVGQARGDRVMLEQGKQLYGRTLHELRTALKDAKRAGSEALLGVPRVVGMFEVLFGSDANRYVQARSWESHAAGDMALMKAKGPQAFQTGVAHALFLEGRLNPIIAGIATRKATLMYSKEWQTVPWEGRIKLPKDSLIDILAALPEILEEQDRLAAYPHSVREIHIQRLLQKCQEIDDELDEWSSVNKDCIYEAKVEDPVQITFPDLVTAHLAVLYWTTCVILYDAINETNALLPTPPAFYLPSPQISKKHPRPYAHRIVRSLPYFFLPSSGLWGATEIAFPIGITLKYLRGRNSEEDKVYKAWVLRACTKPGLPVAIKTFIESMQLEVESRKAEALI